MKILSPDEVKAKLDEMPWGGLTRVAEHLGMTRQAISKIKSDAEFNPTWSTLVRFSEYFENN